jgi:hypothetical protein
VTKEEVSKQEIWHKRMGHLNFKALEVMAKREVVLGLPKSLTCLKHVCEHCALSKSHRQPYKRSITRSLEPLQLLHSDIHSVSTLSNGGAKMYVTFIDDFSRFCWIFILKS